MPYVKKDDGGKIVAVSEIELEGFEPLQLSYDPEIEKREGLEGVAELIASTMGSEQVLAATDMELVRVIEDLVMVLVDKNQIRFTDLPDAAQRKMLERRRIRDSMHTHLNLLPDDDNDGLI